MEIQKLWWSYIFSKYSKFNLDLRNAAKNCGNVFRFWDNCIISGIVNFSLLRTGYLSSVANVLTRCPKNFHVNKRKFFDYNFPASEQLIWSKSYDAGFNIVWTLLPYCLSKGLLKRDFLDIYLTTFSESVISNMQNLWGLSSFSKYSKFNLNFKNTAKMDEKLFVFEIIPSKLVSLNFVY